jgi:hypothetical protein
MRIDDAILSGSVLGSSAVVSITGSFTGSGHIATASNAFTSSYAITSSKVWITDYATSEPTASAMVYILDTVYEDPSFVPNPQTLYLIYEI